MHYKTMRIPATAMAGIMLLALGGCSETAPDLPDGPGGDAAGAKMAVKVQALKAPAASGNEVELLQFSEGRLTKKAVSTGDEEETPVVFPRLDGCRIYAVNGYSIAAVEGETDEETVSHATVSTPAGAQSAPIFYSTVVSPDEEDSSLEIALTRGVARVDVSNADPDMTVESVRLDGAPVTTYVFPLEGSVSESDFTTYTNAFPEGMTGLEKGVFTLYETSDKVTVTLSGKSKGQDAEVTVEIPAVKRNKVYTVRLTRDESENPGGEQVAVKTSVTVSDWEEGEGFAGSPDTVNGLDLDIASSKLPGDASYDAAARILHLSASGADGLKLAFRADVRVDIDTIILRGPHVEEDGLIGNACTVKGRTVAEKGNDILTTYELKVLPQLVCRPEYDIDIRIRKASMVSSYDHVKIRVAQHPKQIRTVVMGGVEWMCFNATSANLEDQIFTLDDTTVEQMYNEHFVDCIGNYFQYGKENPFSPWTSNNPSQFADQTRNIPWNSPDRMPLPKGYHVASSAEWKALMPNGIVLPAAWRTASGDSIKGSVVTLPGTIQTPSAAVNAKNFLMRYVLFESVTTGNKLYVPFGGVKSNSTAEVPGHGGTRLETRTAYWIMEDRYTWLIDYKATPEKTDGAVLKQDRWNYDGFLLVRGVKD